MHIISFAFNSQLSNAFILLFYFANIALNLSACSFFKILLNSGVKIYKFTDGFVHSKVFVSDDVRAVVGTINMDYRSLYLHFENGIYMEDLKEIFDIKQDVTYTISKCKNIKINDAKVGFFKEIWQSILRLFAPLF